MAGVGQLPLVGKYLDNSVDDAMEELKKNQNLLRQLDPNSPEYKQIFREIDPLEYQATKIEENPALKQDYSDYLARLSGLSTSGLSDEDRAAFYAAGQEAGDSAASKNASLIENARSRGISGGGTEFALRQMANSEAARRQQAQNMDQAAKAAQQRYLYTQAYGSGVNTARAAENDIATRNANIMNDFNKMNTKTANDNMLRNAEGLNDVRQQNYNNMKTYIGGLTGQNKDMSDAYLGKADYNKKVRDEGKDDFSKIMKMGMG